MDSRGKLINAGGINKMRWGDDWIDFTQHCRRVTDTAEKWRGVQHQILDESSVENIPGSSDRAARAQSLAEYDDLHFLSMGAVYTHCCVPFDIFEQFRKLMGYDGPRVVMRFDHEIVEGLDAWSHILEGMDRDKINLMRQFLTTQAIRKQTDDNQTDYWVIKHAEVLVADPIAVSRHEYTEGKTAVIDVYVPSGSRYRLVPDVTTLLPLRLQRERPTPDVLKEFGAVSSVTFQGR
jgi:hypothetical protein